MGLEFGATSLSLSQRNTVVSALKQASGGSDEAPKKLLPIFERVYEAMSALSPGQHTDERIGQAVDWFNKWAAAYAQSSRYFHNVDHLQEMTVTSCRDYEILNNALGETLTAAELIRFQRINTIAGFYHDVEYAHVDGRLTENSEALMPFLTEDAATKAYAFKAVFDGSESEEKKKLVNMVLEVFGQKKGVALNPFGGMNELLSAMEAALDLQEHGFSKKDILTVVASIEATVPFKKKDRMDVLRTNIENVISHDDELKNMGVSEIDKIVGNATILANQDVIGLAGGLRPGEPATADHIRDVMKGTDKLHAEEVPALRTQVPGDYHADELVKALYKQHTLFNTMLAPTLNGAKNESFMVFHGATMKSTNLEFPPQASLTALESIVKETVGPVLGLVLRARVAAVRSLAAFAKDPENNPADAPENGLATCTVKDLLGHGLVALETKLNPDSFVSSAGSNERLAYEVLSNERAVGRNDTSRSPAAAYILQELGEAELKKLVPDANLGPDEQRAQILGGDHTAFRGALRGEAKLNELEKLLLPGPWAAGVGGDQGTGWVKSVHS